MLESDYVIIEQFGTRVSVKGRLCGGYVLGINSKVVSRTSLLCQTDEYCILRANSCNGHILFCFVYFSPKSNVNLLDLFRHLKSFGNNIVIIGDMNARIGRFQNYSNSRLNESRRESMDSTLNARDRRLIRILKDTDFRIINGSTVSDINGCFTFVNSNGSSVIDLCIATERISQCFDFQVLDLIHSCHLPILVSYYYKPKSEVNSVPVIRWDNNLKETFVNNLSKLEEINGYPENILEYIQQIKEACKNTGLVVKRSNTMQIGGPKWFDKKCLYYRKVAQRNLRKFRRSTEIDRNKLRKLYIGSQRSYRNLCKAKRTRLYKTLESRMSDIKRTKEFYAALQYFRPRKSQTIQQEHVTPEKFRNFYSELFSNDQNDDNDADLDLSDHVSECNELDSDFSFAELNVVLKLLSTNKAAGPDQVVNEVWKSLKSQQRLVLLDLINAMWRDNKIYEELLETVIVPIFKKADKKDPANYRPISLVNTFTKILTSLMTERLNNWCEKNSKISMYQAAYRKGMG